MNIVALNVDIPNINLTLNADVARNQRIRSVVQEVLAEKERLTQEAPQKNWVDTAVLVGGDVFTIGFFALTLVSKYIAPATSAMPGMVLTSTICGDIAGIINILVSFVSLKQAIQALANGDQKLSFRLFWDFATGILIGVALILSATALRVAALSATAAFLAQPWVFPLLFLLGTIFMVLELAKREKSIATNTDLGSQIKLDTTQDKGTLTLPPFFEIAASDEEIQHAVIQKMETLQTEMGVKAALTAFVFWKTMLASDVEASHKAMTELKQEVSAWNRAQHARSVQQGLYFVATVLGLGFNIPPHILDGINTAFSALGNGMALYMDSFWHFKRNIPIVVPKVETDWSVLAPHISVEQVATA